MISNYYKIAIGTVQFGMPYGIANTTGQVNFDEGKKILDTARQNGIHTIDTAIGYGDSEEQLGRMGLEGWDLITKVLPIPEDHMDADKWIRESVYASLERLKIDSLYGVLFHAPDQLLGDKGIALYNALHKLKLEGLVKKIGISVYAPEQLDSLFADLDFDIVQAPFNILDRRLKDSGWLAKLKLKKVEVHVRSLFLQGLLLMPAAMRPEKFNKWKMLWKKFDDWLMENNLTPLQACLNFVLNHPEIDKAVVGVDSLRNIQEIINATGKPIPELPSYLNSNDTGLINPALW